MKTLLTTLAALWVLLLMAGCPTTTEGESTDEDADTAVTEETVDEDTVDEGDGLFDAEDAAASEFAPKNGVYEGEVAPIEDLRAELDEVYTVEFVTTSGNFTAEIYPELAPTHAVRFLELVRDGYYNNLHIHRIAPSWVIQWGELIDQKQSEEAWMGYLEDLRADGKTDEDIMMMQQTGEIDFEPVVYPDYEVRNKLVMNVQDEAAKFELAMWTLTFAKGGNPDSASTQPFVSLTDDTMRLADPASGGFSPFGYVIAGRENLEALVSSFEPAMQQAKDALRVAMNERLDDEEFIQQMAAQYQMGAEEIKGMMQQQIEMELENDLSWGREMTSEMWDPFTQAMITSATIVTGPAAVE